MYDYNITKYFKKNKKLINIKIYKYMAIKIESKIKILFRFVIFSIFFIYFIYMLYISLMINLITENKKL
jgi:hypothetical protein